MASNVLDVSDSEEYDDGLTNTLQGLKLSDEESASLPTWMEGCETALLWHSQQKKFQSHDHIISRCVEKLAELLHDKEECSLLRYSLLLRLTVSYFVLKNKEKLDETMRTIQQFYAKESAQNDTEFENYKKIISYIVDATKAHFYANNKETVKESKKIAENLQPIGKMSNQDLAKLFAIKINYILYSYYDKCESDAVKVARKTLSLDPDNHNWKFLLAKAIRQERKDVPFSKEIPKEEINLLKDALSQNKCASYLIYTAQVYRESASQALRINRNERGFYGSKLSATIENMNQIALNYYKEALEDSEDNASNLRRIGYGIMNLPRKIADYDLAEKCLLKSLKICESLNTLHILGCFYERYRKDYKTALEYFEKFSKTEFFNGLYDMIKLKYILDKNYDPREDIENALKGAMKQKYRTQLLINLGSFYLLIKRDLLQSLKYFNEVIKDGEESPYMLEFKCPFLRMYDPINLYEYLANEALLFLKKYNSSTEDDDEVIYELMALLESINTICPKLKNLKPHPHLIKILCDKSEEILAKENSTNQPGGLRKRFVRLDVKFPSTGHSFTRSHRNSGNRGARDLSEERQQEPRSKYEAYEDVYENKFERYSKNSHSNRNTQGAYPKNYSSNKGSKGRNNKFDRDY